MRIILYISNLLLLYPHLSDCKQVNNVHSTWTVKSQIVNTNILLFLDRIYNKLNAEAG